ncbi:transcription antitermination factor NusB [Vampirovibrio sp.]|uniref:transcription antitermination factor NusB n=1 Tax=Vampirovibrio sp. TaxID=2717857 RepID=UPI0035947FD8
MNARHAARELALLTLFQLDKQGDGHINPEALSNKSLLQEQMLSSVRALSGEAEFQIQSAADELAEVSRYLLAYELEHPVNLESALDAPVRAVPIPSTREMVEKIERCLQGAEYLFEALRIPELISLVGSENVQEYAFNLMKLVAEHRAELDELLNQYMAEWRMDRLIRMDAYILRLAAAEMKYVEKVDLSVSINEAVELAKQFSSEESFRLIHGVLGALAEKVSEETGKSLRATTREQSIT